jgi:hypothetical protein
MKLWQWVGVVVVAVCSGALGLLAYSSLSAAPPAAETTQVSPIVTSPVPSLIGPSVSSTPTLTADPIDRVGVSEVTELKIPGVLSAPFGGAIATNDKNQLVPPNSSEVFRWVKLGLPGCPSRGTVFLVGHTVRAGGGVFDHLQQVQPGQLVILETETGTVRYRVEKTNLYDRRTLPDVDKVFANVPGRLVLVGCFLNKDGSPQNRNFVVTARIVNC